MLGNAKASKKFATRVAASSGLPQLYWTSTQSQLRILTYHGICKDDQVNQPWIPQYFVTETQFQRQMECLRKNANVVKLSDAVDALAAGSLPPRAVAITFDDGYANNLHLGVPVLKKYGFPATIFLATSHMQSGEMFVFDRLRFVELHTGSNKFDVQFYKNSPLDTVRGQIEAEWAPVAKTITAEQHEALRPLRLDELKDFPTELISFGGHSHGHCILRNETRPRREMEIRTSIALVNEWTSTAIPVFSYPNGQARDFDREDEALLRSLGIKACLTTTPGLNGNPTSLMTLRRLSLVSAFDDAGFFLYVSGFRTFVKSAVSGLRG